MNTRTKPRRIAALLAASGLLVAACAEDDPASDSTDAPEEAEAAESTEAPEDTEAETTEAPAETDATEDTTADETETTEATDDESGDETDDETDGSESAADGTAFGLDYIGGTAGEASGEPYRIGFAHSGDFFPEGNIAATAAAGFINSELGGVGGRPLELVECNVATPEDGARCGAEFANAEDIDLVVGGLVLQGPADLYSALEGTAAAIIAGPLDVSDYLSPFGVAYNTGALGAGIGGAVFVVEDLQPQTAALVVTDDVAGRGGASVLTPIVEAAGIELKQVFVPPTATAPEIASALQATGADTADVVSLGLFEQGCIAAYDALESLGLSDVEVVTTSVCWGNAVQEHLTNLGVENPIPNWNFSWFGYNPFVDDLEPSVAAYLEKIEQYGGGDVKYSVAAPIVFDAIMSAAQTINTAGVDTASFETLDAAVRGFTGPSMIQSGPQECGVPIYAAVCPTEVGVFKHQDGEWTPIRSGSDGTAIDLSPYTRPEG